MKKINETLKKVVNSANFPFILFFIILVIFHIKIETFFGDDIFFKNIITEENNIIQYLTQRYNIWSSRLIIETVLVTLAKFELKIWKILNVGIYMLLAKSISKICLKEKDKNFNYIICGLLLLLPISVINNTGWLATTTNYLWVVSFGMYALSIIINYIRETKIPKWEYVFYLLATLYACNQEQMAAVILAVYGTFIFTQLFKKGYKYVIKNQKFLLILFVVAIISLVFILTCPGNLARKEAEVKTWYPEYENFRLLEKIELGLTSTMKYFVLDTNNIFIIFTLTILLGVCTLNKNKFVKLLAVIPFLVSIFNACFLEYVVALSPNIASIIEIFKADQLVMSLSQISIKYVFVMLGYVIILLLIPVGIYNIFKKNIQTYICIGIYLLGLATRFVMSFSPTIFASGERTFIFLYISFIICTIIILQKIFDNRSKNIILEEKSENNKEIEEQEKIKEDIAIL